MEHVWKFEKRNEVSLTYERVININLIIGNFLEQKI